MEILEKNYLSNIESGKRTVLDVMEIACWKFTLVMLHVLFTRAREPMRATSWCSGIRVRVIRCLCSGLVFMFGKCCVWAMVFPYRGPVLNIVSRVPLSLVKTKYLHSIAGLSREVERNVGERWYRYGMLRPARDGMSKFNQVMTYLLRKESVCRQWER